MNESYRNKSTLRAKLKAASQNEKCKYGETISRICLETPLNSPINLSKIIYNQFNINLEQFREEELEVELKESKADLLLATKKYLQIKDKEI